MHGRDAEWGLVIDMLRRVRAGRGEVLLVEGEPGMGKSLFLAEAGAAALAQGFSVIGAAAHELDRVIPLCPLLVAFSDSAGLLAEISTENANSQMRAIAAVREHVQGLTDTGPVLVTVDDVQFADPATLLALRLLPRQLSARPVGWLLARSAEHGTGADSLFTLLGKEGASGITLGGLTGDAVAGLVADLARGQPDKGLLSMLSGVGGNPKLIREFIAGLREEQLLRTSGDQVTAVADRIPRRLHGVVRGQITELGAMARQLLEAAAVLGRSFAVMDLAEMLGQPPVALLPALDDVMAAGILVPDGDVLSFRDIIAWQAVTGGIPDPVARALQLQFAEILLERGSTQAAADYLLKGAWRSDRRELDLLSGAAGELMQASPETAAELALRSLELTDPADAAWLGRSLIAIRSLVAARRLAQAVRITEASLSRPAAICEQAELHCGLATIYNLMGKPERARTEAQWVLDRADVPENAREEASVLLLRALAGLPDLQEAEDRARAVLTAHREGNAKEATAAAGTLAVLRWRQGRIADALRFYREAVSGDWSGKPGGLRPFGAQLDLASRLIDIRELDEARTLIDAPVEDASMVSVADSQARPALLRARIHLIEGRLDAADEAARAALSPDPDTGDYFHNVAARYLLARIALRRGDLPEVESWLAALPADVLEPSSAGQLPALCSVLTALVTEVRAGPDAALRSVSWLYDDIGEFRWLLIGGPEAAPWLVRLALAAGDEKRARLVAAEAVELGRANQAFPAVAVGGKHAAGLCYQDAELLEIAARTQPDMWARASAMEDLGVLLTRRTDKHDGIALLDQAHDGFVQLGAARDVARVRYRLRALGVMRRHWVVVRGRPGDGWGSLTDTEASVAELAARGLTNRQIAEQTFVSVHTVAFHLRQIFRKLGVTSRVELARIALKARQAAD